MITDATLAGTLQQAADAINAEQPDDDEDATVSEAEVTDDIEV